MSQLKILKTIQLNIQEAIHWLKSPQSYFASGSGCYRFLPLEEVCRLLPAIGLKVSSCFGITFHFHEGVNLTDTEKQFYQNCPDRKAIGLYRFKHTKAPDSPLTLQGSPIGLRFLELFMANPPRYQDAARGHSRAFKSFDTHGEAFAEFITTLEEWGRHLDCQTETRHPAEKAEENGQQPNDKDQFAADTKITSALVEYHLDGNGKLRLGLAPMKQKDIFKKAKVDQRTVVRYMKKVFGGMNAYKVAAKSGSIVKKLIERRDEKVSRHRSYEE